MRVRGSVSPGYTPAIGAACREYRLPLLPGVSTASEAMRANDDGYSFLKLFPATAVGGIALLKALAGPLADIAFCPPAASRWRPHLRFCTVQRARGRRLCSAFGDEERRLGPHRAPGARGVLAAGVRLTGVFGVRSSS